MSAQYFYWNSGSNGAVTWIEGYPNPIGLSVGSSALITYSDGTPNAVVEVTMIDFFGGGSNAEGQYAYLVRFSPQVTNTQFISNISYNHSTSGADSTGGNMSNQIKKKYLGENSVDGSKIKLLAGQAIKIVDSSGSDVDLIKLSGNNEVLVKGVEVGLKSQVDAEQSRAQGEEARIEGKVDTEKARAEGVEAGHNTRLLALEADPVTKTYVDGEVSDLQGQINNVLSNIDPVALDSLTEVVAAFQSADQTIQGSITSLSQSATTALSNEISRATGEEQRIEGKIDTEISNRQSAVSNLQSQINSLDSGSSAAVAAEETRAMAAESALDARLDIIEGVGEGSVAKAEQDAKDYTDGAISTLSSSVTSAISSEASARQSADTALQGEIDALESSLSSAQSSFTSALSSEESARISGDNALDARLDIIEGSGAGSIAKSLQDGKDYTDAQVLIEKNRAEGAESSLQSQINSIVSNTDPVALDSLTEIVSAFQTADGNLNASITALSTSASSALASETTARQNADIALQAEIDALESSLSGAQSSFTSALSSEQSARESADNALDARLDVIEGSGAGSVAKALVDAKAYTDSSITTLQSAVTSEITSAVASEASARQSADNALDTRVTALEALQDGPEFHKESFTVGSNGVTASSVTLGHQAMANSIVVFVGRLGAHQGVDFNVSVVGGVSVVTWIGSMASGGAEEIVSGDNIYVTYAKMI